jgi:hypothetical protein
MSQIFTIEHDKVVIKKLALETLEGDLTVAGTLTVDNLVVLNASETAESVSADFGNWAVKEEVDLLTKGLSWSWTNSTVHLGYRTNNRLWTSGNMDIDQNRSYMIDGVSVLSANELSSQVTRSNLKQVGILKSLQVTGDTALAEVAYFNSGLGRVGINTDEPNSTLSIVDNNVEVVIGSPRDGIAELGTYTNSDLEIITDNTPRITIKTGGQIVFGNPATNNADVRIYGTLHVETVVSDNRVDRYQPLEFKTNREQSIYGQGFIWTGSGDTRRLVMAANPDRLLCSESFDIGTDQSYYVGGVPVLSAVGLGSSVTKSNLSKLGTLEDLNVEGEATFLSHINASRAVINAKTIVFNDGQEFTISNGKLASNNKISFTVADDETYYADAQEIAIGNRHNPHRSVKIFGSVSIGINNSDDDVDLAIKGNIKFADKKFVTGTSAPVSGTFNKGDICWNQTPVADNYVGWICIEDGAPGRWLPFGAIARS